MDGGMKGWMELKAAQEETNDKLRQEEGTVQTGTTRWQQGREGAVQTGTTRWQQG